MVRATIATMMVMPAMTTHEVVAELDARYSSDGARPTEWADVVRRLERAAIFWVTSVRSDGRPHVTPLLAVWLDDALCFCTGPTEQKAKNLSHNAHCSLTTGCNELDAGLDIVVEGVAANLRDDTRLRLLAAAYESKYATIGISTCATARSITRAAKRSCSRLRP